MWFFRYYQKNKTDVKCTCIGVTLNGEWEKYYKKMKVLDFLSRIVELNVDFKIRSDDNEKRKGRKNCKRFFE